MVIIGDGCVEKGNLVTRNFAVRVAAIAGVGVVAASVALAAPASAKDGTTTLSAGNGTVGVNQVLTATYAANDATSSCDDEQGAVNFDFQISNGTDLGTITGTCTPVSNGSYTPVATWTATMNWTPSGYGTFSVTAYASRQLLGGTSTVGQASKKVAIAPSPQSAVPTKPQNLKVTGVSTNAVSLDWAAPSNQGGSPVSSYTVKWTGPTSGQVTSTATNTNVGTLNAGSTYTFSVSAVNAQGSSDWVSITQNTANAPTPPPIQQQTLNGPMWIGGGPKVKSNQWKTFNNTANLDTNAGREAQLSAINRSSSLKSVTFRYDGDNAQVKAVLKPGAKSGSFTLREFSPALPGFNAMSMTRVIKVVK